MATVVAAGGVVWRSTPGGIRIAVIHRPHRADWSLPKGKLDAGERLITCARREVMEETGLHVAVQQQIGVVRYRLGDDTSKKVSYWAMRHTRGSFRSNAEADKLRWMSVEQARAVLSFAGDREIVARFDKQPVAESVVLLVRHARAGKRSTWKKDDSLRPVDALGRRQAKAIATLADVFAPTWVGATTPVRCHQTVAPLADGLGRKVHDVPALSDAVCHRDFRRAQRALTALASRRRVSVVCSQGGAIPALLDWIDPERAPHESRKGSVWALFLRDGQVLASDYYGRP